MTSTADTTGAPTDTLNRDGLEQARRFGWVYEHQGRVAVIGAGAYHAGEISDPDASRRPARRS